MSLRKSSKSIRCSQCKMSAQWCYCKELTPVEIKTPVTFIIHQKERYLPSNTANLLNLISDNCEFYVHGSRKSQNLKLLPDHHPLYLYPDEQAQELTPSFVATIDRPIQLIVPDGTWRQTVKMKRRISDLNELQSIKITPAQCSQYFLRRQKSSTGLSTFEAVSQALEILEPNMQFQDLMANFEIMMQAFAKANPFKAANFFDSTVK